MLLEMNFINNALATNNVNEEWKSDFKSAINIVEKWNKLSVAFHINSLF